MSRRVSIDFHASHFSPPQPVFDGGKPIFEYEIHWSVCHEHRVGKRVTIEVEKLPVLTTSYWCLRKAVSHTGFVLRGLRGFKLYSNISVRALNSVGPSPFSNVIKEVRTLDPIPPSVPLHVRVRKTTASSIQLVWSEPFTVGNCLSCVSVGTIYLVIRLILFLLLFFPPCIC